MVWPGKGMTWKQLFLELKREWNEDDLSDVAGAVTFSAILAVFPFLLFLVSLASVIIDPKVAESLIDQLSQVAPPAVTQILGDRIRSLGQDKSVGLLTLGALTAVWAASGGMMALMRALNTCYDVRESRPFWKTRGIAIVMTLVSAAIAIVAGAAAIVLPPIAEAIGGPLGTAILWLRIPVAALLMMFLWAVLYYVLPDVEQRFKFITPGSAVGVIIWALASWGFSKYVTNFGKYDATYGALGGVIVLLFWMWISSQVVLAGAEMNAILEHRSPEGKRVGAKSMAQTGADQTKSEKHEQEEGRRVRPVIVADPVQATKIAAKNALGLAALRFVFRRFSRTREA